MKINIDNYEEIMFRLVEDDFDEPTRIDLLQQIEADALFKFEWESWQKTKFVDPLENYAMESRELTEKIILIAEPQTAGRKRVAYYWSAAASIILLIGTLFLLTADFSSRPKHEVAEAVKKLPVPAQKAIAPVQKQAASIADSDQNPFQNQKRGNAIVPVVADSSKLVPAENALAEISPAIDTVPVKTNELAKAPEKKPRYTITIETSDFGAKNLNNNEMAQNQKGKIKHVFTNTKIFLSRKPNGEPDKLYLLGDENSYLCININY